LDEYLRKKFVCERCGRVFESARALNIHITKIHTRDERPPLYHGEGIKDIKSEGRFVDLRIRIKRSLWNDIKRTAMFERMKPEEVIIASLINSVHTHIKIDKEATYIS